MFNLNKNKQNTYKDILMQSNALPKKNKSFLKQKINKITTNFLKEIKK